MFTHGMYKYRYGKACLYVQCCYMRGQLISVYTTDRYGGGGEGGGINTTRNIRIERVGGYLAVLLRMIK
jgi:hypothetical protein